MPLENKSSIESCLFYIQLVFKMCSSQYLIIDLSEHEQWKQKQEVNVVTNYFTAGLKDGWLLSLISPQQMCWRSTIQHYTLYEGNYTDSTAGWRPVALSYVMSPHLHQISDNSMCTSAGKGKSCSIEAVLRATSRFQSWVRSNLLLPSMVKVCIRSLYSDVYLKSAVARDLTSEQFNFKGLLIWKLKGVNLALTMWQIIPRLS